MKTLLKTLVVLTLVPLFAACAAQKPVGGTDKASADSEKLSRQALQALDGREFIIEGREFFLPNGLSSEKSFSENYVSMLGDKAVIRLSPSLFPYDGWTELNIEDEAAVLTKIRCKKNGDIEYSLKVNGSQYGQDREVLFTLYKNSNKCFVHVNYGSRAGAQKNIVDFIGYMRPYAAAK